MERNEGANAGHTLQELGDSPYQVAKGEHDIRGWKIFDGQGNRIGDVKELLCDAQNMKVRYLIVDLEGNLLDLEPRDIVVPISMTELHGPENAVVIPQVTLPKLQALPAYDRSHFSPDQETLVQRIFVGDFVFRPGTAQVPGVSSAEVTPREVKTQVRAQSSQRVQHVIGLFTTPAEVDQKVQALSANGIPQNHVQVAQRQSIAPHNGLSPQDFETYFRQLFSTKEEANQNFEKFRQCNALVVVRAHTPEEAQLAARLLDTSRTPDLDIMVEPSRRQGSETTFSREENPIGASPDNQTPPQEENLEINVTQQPSSTQPFPQEGERAPRQERGFIEENSEARSRASSEFGSFQEGSIILTEFAEIPIVSKEPHVVEEINIGKEVEVREETVRDSVIRTEIDIEEIRKDPPSPSIPPSSF
ncbi:PRC-barrel domain-containing protein [Rufibacter soli]